MVLSGTISPEKKGLVLTPRVEAFERLGEENRQEHGQLWNNHPS